MKSNVKLIVRTTLLFWLLAKLMSWRLWIADRSFPLVPALPYPSVFHLILLAAFVGLTILLVLKPTNKYLLLTLVFNEIFSMLGDEMRWQPWEYQYAFIILIALINRDNQQRFLSCFILVLASTYFFSGLEKINGGFLNTVWTKLILIRFLHLPPSVYLNRFIRHAGWIIPIAEISFGCILLQKKKLQLLAWLPIGMHLFIMFLLSPFGIHYNSIVIPWNLSLAIFVFLIFIRTKTSFSFSDPNWIVVLGWVILPTFGIFGYWDKYLSSSLYSGKGEYAKAYVNDLVKYHPELKPYTYLSNKGFQERHQMISLFNWSLIELHVPIPPEKRILQGIEKNFKQRYPDLDPIFYYYK